MPHHTTAAVITRPKFKIKTNDQMSIYQGDISSSRRVSTKNLIQGFISSGYDGIVNSNVTSSVLGNKAISPPWAISRAFT